MNTFWWFAPPGRWVGSVWGRVATAVGGQATAFRASETPFFITETPFSPADTAFSTPAASFSLAVTPFSTPETPFWTASTVDAVEKGVSALQKGVSVAQKGVSLWEAAVSIVQNAVSLGRTGVSGRRVGSAAVSETSRRVFVAAAAGATHTAPLRSWLSRGWAVLWSARAVVSGGWRVAMAAPWNWDTPGLTWDMPGLVWNGSAPEPPQDLLPSSTNKINQGGTMEYWEITKDRAQQSLPVWVQFTPNMKINNLGHTDLDGFIDEYEPKVQARTAAQDEFDEAERAVQRSLLVMKILGTKVPAIIEGMLSDQTGLMKDVDDLYATTPKREGTVLKRARDLHPVWVRANTALTGTTPPQAALTRKVGGTIYTAALLKAQVDGFTDLVKTMRDKESALNLTRMALRSHDRKVDKMIKGWFKAAKADAEEDSDLATALEGIPTEQGTVAPETIEIATVLQGGEGGLQVLVSYVAGGGDHATTKSIKWQVGAETNYPHSAPLDPSGNALGPFAEGAVVKIITEVSNSVGTRTTATRTITLGPPIV